MAKKRPFKTAAQAAAKWLAAMQSTTTQNAYAQGTANKGGAATQGAVAAVQDGRYLTGVQNAVTNGSIVEALQNPMAAQLYNANTGQKGAAALGMGAQKKLPKYQASIANLQNVYQAMRDASSQVDPTGNRATAAARQNAALAVLMASGKKGGGRLPG